MNIEQALWVAADAAQPTQQQSVSSLEQTADWIYEFYWTPLALKIRDGSSDEYHERAFAVLSDLIAGLCPDWKPDLDDVG